MVETSGKKIVFKKLACCAKCDGTVDIPTSPKSFTCQECNQNFKVNLAKASNPMCYSYSYCRRVSMHWLASSNYTIFFAFQSQHHLNVHTLTHRTETCERCGKIFSRTTGKGGTATKHLKAHLKTCKGPRVYPCSGCGMEFKAKKKCQKHEASCKEMLYCKRCRKYFKTRTWTVRHLCSKFDT